MKDTWRKLTAEIENDIKSALNVPHLTTTITMITQNLRTLSRDVEATFDAKMRDLKRREFRE